MLKKVFDSHALKAFLKFFFAIPVQAKQFSQ
jgi:hypothetical protein